MTRGNNAEPGKPEDPGAIKTFGFKNGMLTGLASIAPGNGLGFGPRHLDFHPTQPWVFVSIERQNKLYVYKLDADDRPVARPAVHQGHAGRSQHQVSAGRRPDPRASQRPLRLLTNRSSALTEFNGQKVFAGGENSVAVFAIDQTPASRR